MRLYYNSDWGKQGVKKYSMASQSMSDCGALENKLHIA